MSDSIRQRLDVLLEEYRACGPDPYGSAWRSLQARLRRLIADAEIEATQRCFAANCSGDDLGAAIGKIRARYGVRVEDEV